MKLMVQYRLSHGNEQAEAFEELQRAERVKQAEQSQVARNDISKLEEMSTNELLQRLGGIQFCIDMLRMHKLAIIKVLADRESVGEKVKVAVNIEEHVAEERVGGEPINDMSKVKIVSSRRMENYGSLPVGKRTRHMEAEMYKKCHEEMKKKRKLPEDGKLTSPETCSTKMNVGKADNVGKNIGVRKRSNGLGRAKKKKFSAPREKLSVSKSAVQKSRGISRNGKSTRRTKSGTRLHSDASDNDARERELRDEGLDEREVIITDDDEEDVKTEEGDGASREQRSDGVSSGGEVAKKIRSHCGLQFHDAPSNTVYKEEINEFTDISDDENGIDEKVEELNVEEEEEEVEEKDDACYEDDNDSTKGESDYVVNDIEEGHSNEEEIEVVALDISDVDMDEPETSFGNCEKVEELNVEEEKEEEKDEACSKDHDADMKEDNDDIVNENEEGRSDVNENEEGCNDVEEVDDVVSYASSDVDMDEPETSLSSEDGSCKSYEDGGERTSANSDVRGQDSVVEEQDDEEEESQTPGNEQVDPVDIGKQNFAKSNVEKHGFVATRTRSSSSLAPCTQKVNRSMESSVGDGKFAVNDETMSIRFRGKNYDAGKKKVKHETIRNPKKRKRRCNTLKDHEVEKILVASILKKRNENFPCEEITKSPSKPTISWKFTFGNEESPSNHKEPEEEEILQLWDEMALSLSQNDVNGNQMEENEPETCNDVGDANFCSQGNHLFVLDEELGVVCQRCAYVRLEIKYYAAPMSKNPWGRSERKEYLRTLNKFPDDFRYEDLEFNSESGLSSFPDLHGTVWSLVPGVRRGMHAHQVEGFEFLWKNIAGGMQLDDLKKTVDLQSRGGCVISHAPGTGKTRLTIAFLQTYMKLYPTCKPIIIAPTGMLQTWESEFKKWQVEVPFLSLKDPELNGNEHEGALKLLRPGNTSLELIRLIKLVSWKLGGGVLALSYKLFVQLTSRPPTGRDKAWRSLLDLPGLLILDEGHTPRNDNSVMWKALSKIKTWRKIILSGTPFQNNFDELFNIFCLIRPKFVEKSIGPRGRESRARAKWASLTSQINQSGGDGCLNKEEFDRVWREIAPFVHVHKGSILQKKLPGLKESLVLLEPLPMQKGLLQQIDNALTDRTFNWEQAVSLVCVHPSLLRKKLNIPSLGVVDTRMLESVRRDPDAGAKTKFVMELIRLCDLVGEKVLVFSQLIDPLNMIVKLLEEKLHWVEGQEILLIRGATDIDQRQTSIRDFNNSRSASKIMLASTRACSEGISLVGASRVVLLDVGWNPSVEWQAICRAYRLGQEKLVHVYHLLASGTKEEEKYGRQATKYRCSELLFQSADPSSDHNTKMPPACSDDRDKLLEQMVEGEKLKHIISKVTLIERS